MSKKNGPILYSNLYKMGQALLGYTVDVQYAFEAVEGDTINTITPSEHDAGYSS